MGCHWTEWKNVENFLTTAKNCWENFPENYAWRFKNREAGNSIVQKRQIKQNHQVLLESKERETYEIHTEITKKLSTE